MHEIQKRLLSLISLKNVNELSYREIAQLVGCAHASQVKHHLNKLLEKRMVIKTVSGKLEVVPSRQEYALSVPVLGEADCGEATQLAEDRVQSYLQLSPSMLTFRINPQVYALKAQGDSMNRADINGNAIDDGDYVIVEKKDNYKPENGDYIVSIINGLANIKRLKIDSENRRIVLLSESFYKDLYPPILISEEDLHYYHPTGKVIDVIKGVDELE